MPRRPTFNQAIGLPPTAPIYCDHCGGHKLVDRVEVAIDNSTQEFFYRAYCHGAMDECRIPMADDCERELLEVHAFAQAEPTG